MEQLLQQIEEYRKEIESIVPNGADALEAYRIKFLGTKGILKGLFTEMKNVPADKKKESRVTSILKTTGRILKRPFRF